LTSLERWNRKKGVENAKKKIVNDGIFVKFWISNISNVLKKKTHSFVEFFDKISDLYNKTTQILRIFWQL